MSTPSSDDDATAPLQAAPTVPPAAHEGLPQLRQYQHVPLRATVPGAYPSPYAPISQPRPVAPVTYRGPGSFGLAMLIAAVVSFLCCGLLWAASVIAASDHDIFPLAFVFGAAVGYAARAAYGRALYPGGRIIAGLLAAGGIIVGEYVVFAHELKRMYGTSLAARGLQVGYLNKHEMGFFLHHYFHILVNPPTHALGVFCAFAGALWLSGRATRT